MFKHICMAGLVSAATAGTASAVQINEFEPNPFGSDPVNQLVELRGAAGDSFTGNLFSIEADVSGGIVDRATAVSGTFDADGLLTVSIPDLENPSFTLVLSGSDATATAGTSVTDFSVLGTVYDAIGIPDSVLDQANLLGAALGGTDFVYTGDEPKLIFRDSVVPTTLWALNDPPTGLVFNANGTTALPGEFVSGDPLVSTFGAVNPSAFGATVWINEFEPNPFGSDQATQLVELRGTPGAPFEGSLVSVEADTPGAIIDRAAAITGVFDANGLLTVSIPDLENPSFTLVLLNGPAPVTGTAFDVVGLQDSVLDAIGIPDSTLDGANLLGAALGGTDFVYTGDEPKLVFRDGLVPSILWALNDPPGSTVNNANGTTATSGDFVTGDPFVATFNGVNPSIIPEPASAALAGLGAVTLLSRRKGY